MERKMFDFSVGEIKCIKGGIKEACVIVREYLQNSKVSGESISSPNSAVTTEEFIQATNILMAYAWQNRKNDCIPEFWYCIDDCSNIDKCIFCPGEYQIASKDEKGKSLSKIPCPHYKDSGNV